MRAQWLAASLSMPSSRAGGVVCEDTEQRSAGGGLGGLNPQARVD